MSCSISSNIRSSHPPILPGQLLASYFAREPPANCNARHYGIQQRNLNISPANTHHRCSSTTSSSPAPATPPSSSMRLATPLSLSWLPPSGHRKWVYSIVLSFVAVKTYCHPLVITRSEPPKPPVRISEGKHVGAVRSVGRVTQQAPSQARDRAPTCPSFMCAV